MKMRFLQQNILIVAVIGALVFLNIVGLRLFHRVDVTRDRVYTLSNASRETMLALAEPVSITAYFTENLPPPYSSNARYVRDLLEEFRAASKGKLGFEFIDPQSQETDADKEAKREVKQDIFGRRFRDPTSVEKELTAAGIQPVEIRVVEEDQQQTKRAYMAIVIQHQEKKEVIPLIQDVTSLEYDITSLVRKMSRTKMPVIGVLQGHQERPLQEEYRYLQTLLSETYEVRPVELGAQDRFDTALDAILVLGPKMALPENEVKAIDQFLMQGKSVGFFLDAVHVDLRTFQATEAAHGLTALLASYGVTVGNQLVADVSSGNISVSERRNFMVINMPVPFPFIPVVKHMQGDSAISKGLSEVYFPFATQVSVKAPEGITAVTLASSSAKSWLESQPPNIDPRRDWRSETITPTGPYSLMVQLSGKFKSHYSAQGAQSSSGTPVALEAQNEGRMVVVGSSSLAQDQFMNNRSNQALVLNIADWLVLDPAMLAMRNRNLTLAPIHPDVSDATRTAVKFGNALGVPLLLAIYGLARWRMREARRSAIAV